MTDKPTKDQHKSMDIFTKDLLNRFFESTGSTNTIPSEARDRLTEAYQLAKETNLTQPIIDFFDALLAVKNTYGITPDDIGISRENLINLAQRHENIDEHGVSVGGRLDRALTIVSHANARVEAYMTQKSEEAPSGIELWETIQENITRIKKLLNMSTEDWDSFPGQLKNAIDSVDLLSKIIDLSPAAIQDVLRVTKTYRMRLTPYYASLIRRSMVNDPVLLQCVPTGEMVGNVGEEIPPVAADHSPARLVDQFYPQVVTIKATNACAMYCTHCLRIAHIGKKDRIYQKEAYKEALNYIRKNELIRDVLVTGGDVFILPNHMIRWLLEELDSIKHLKTKRLGTRIPVTAPMRIDNELLDILEESNDKKPLRVVTQINTAQEVTPISKEGFKKLSKCVSAVLNQAVLLKGINDTPTKMWRLCETIHESYVRPYYIFNCSYRNPQFTHLRVPVELGRDIVESMYGNIPGDAIPRYICTAGGKVPIHRNNVIGRDNGNIILKKPWSGEEVAYPDADPSHYQNSFFAFAKYNNPK
jgi:lysine 2,3-aminomutase